MVSVILPVHDGAATIGESVASVLAQTLADLELIVIDDGSTDGTLEVLAAIPDHRLKICSTPRSGPAASRNRGIQRAAAGTLAFIDADDLWLPGKLAAQLSALERSPTAAVAYCWTDYIDAAGNCVCPDSRPVFAGSVYEQILTGNFIDSGSNIVVRKQALLDVGGFDERLPVVEDWDLYIRLASRYPFVCVPAALVRYRLSSTSLTTRTLLMEDAYWRVVDQAFADAPASLRHLKRKSVALFYEYLTGKATQGCPSRRNGLTAIRFFAAAVRSRPANLGSLWRRPWVVKALAKALLSTVLPARAMRKLVLAWPSGQGRHLPHRVGDAA
jgi:glycosyltransferase involved in cell wall biosynthesis